MRTFLVQNQWKKAPPAVYSILCFQRKNIDKAPFVSKLESEIHERTRFLGVNHEGQKTGSGRQVLSG
jgi:hypothetical protein